MKTSISRPSRKVDIYHYFRIIGSVKPWLEQRRLINNILVSRLPNPEPGVRSYMLDADGSLLVCEMNQDAIWVISVDTELKKRRRGGATKLLQSLIDYAAKTHKTFVPGIYTNMGRRYLRPKVNQWCKAKGVSIHTHIWDAIEQ